MRPVNDARVSTYGQTGRKEAAKGWGASGDTRTPARGFAPRTLSSRYNRVGLSATLKEQIYGY